MAFNRYYLYSDLMKQLSASQPSEMAVSLVTASNPAISAPSPLKRPPTADLSPLKHMMASGALDLQVTQNPVKLLSDSINNTLNGGVMGSNRLEPLAKKLRLEQQHSMSTTNHSTMSSSLNNNAETTTVNTSASTRLTTQKQTTNLLPGNPGSPADGKPYSCGWGLGNTSPTRSQEVSESSSPQPPTLNPVTPPDQTTTNHSSPPSSHRRHHQAILPHLEPPSPIVIKPAMVVASSPSRSSTDGELSLENTDPNADPMEGHEVCPECQKVFKRKIYLQRHMEREHWSTAKVFKCEDCNYETKHQSNLSVHRRTHTGERPYHCGACGQRYTQGHLLKSHIRSRHGGNMEFYNLDKKSDSTRGRKSLDIKHDVNIVHRQDKISTLLQAAAAANGTQNMQLPKSPFGNLLPGGMPYLNALSPFYNMQNTRPMMTSPLALGNPLSVAGSNFFTLRGMPNLPNSMLPNAATFPSPNSVKVSNSPQKASSNESRMEEMSAASTKDGLLMMKEPKEEPSTPAKVSAVSSPRDREPRKMSMPVFMRQSASPVNNDAAVAAPEDLSLKSSSMSDSERTAVHHSNESSRRRSTSTPVGSSHHENNLVISSGEDGGERKEAEPTDLSSRQSEAATPPTSLHEDQHHHNPLSSILCRPASISENEDSLAMHEQYNDNHESDLESGSLSGGEAMNETRDTFSPKLMMGSSECCQDGCQHADQLTKLRKNVMRMLRCFAPEFSENNIDYSTKEVDQLLYDVMFSNVEELSIKK